MEFSSFLPPKYLILYLVVSLSIHLQCFLRGLQLQMMGGNGKLLELKQVVLVNN